MSRLFRNIRAARSSQSGYSVWITWRPANVIEEVSKEERADLIIVTSGQCVALAQAAKRTGLPVIMSLHDVAFSMHDGNFADLRGISCVANSHFTAKKYREAFGIDSVVIPPFVDANKYRTNSTRENITFINPIPRKGLDIALGIAQRCPEIPFVFVQAWPMSPEEKRVLSERLSENPNVTFLPTCRDMRRVYGKCRILLVPTIIEEAFGRVVTEAHFSGIPVVAAMRGGLPEAVGPGGILLEPDQPINVWTAAVRRLWCDEKVYADLSAITLAYSERLEISRDCQIIAWERVFSNAVGMVPEEASLTKADGISVGL